MTTSTTDTLVDPLPFTVPPEYHGIVNISFNGSKEKQVEIYKDGAFVARRCNCSGVVSEDILLRGSHCDSHSFTVKLECWDNDCGDLPLPPIELQLCGPVVGTPFTGSSPVPPSVETYLFANPTGVITDTIGITIIVQVGIDPTTDCP
jgi:hypothetical protein